MASDAVVQGNVVVDDSGTAQLCDFGLSRIRHEISRTLTRIKMGGFLRYLAPELNFDDEDLRANEASDVYSLSMVIYAMGTGNTPFSNHRKELRAALAAQLRERPFRPNTLGDLNETISGLLWAVMENMWRHEPVKRPSIGEIQTLLHRIFRSTISGDLPLL